MKSTIFILRIIQTLLMVAQFSFAITIWFMPEKGAILVSSLLLAYGISLIANLLQRTSGRITLLLCSMIFLSAGIAQEINALPLAWEFAELIPDITFQVILFPAVLLAVVDWLSFTTIRDAPTINKKAITADERVAIMLQSNTRKDK